MKRKYTKGHYVDVVHKRSDPKIEQRPENTAEPIEQIAIAQLPKQKGNIWEHDRSFETEKETEAVSHNRPASKDAWRAGVAVPKTESKDRFGNSLHKKLERQLQKPSDAALAGKFALYLILFFVLTIIYTLAIVVKSPGFPLGLAIAVAMLGALLTLLTGQLFI